MLSIVRGWSHYRASNLFRSTKGRAHVREVACKLMTGDAGHQHAWPLAAVATMTAIGDQEANFTTCKTLVEVGLDQGIVRICNFSS